MDNYKYDFMRYHVELRKYTEDGDYIEDHFAFETKSEALTFAKTNKTAVYSIHDYEDRDYDPVNLRY